MDLSRRKTVLGLAALALLVALAYAPALRAGFIWDDDTTVTANPLIQGSGGLGQFWLSTHAADYWPAAYTLLWCEWRLWAGSPLGFHVIALALHFGTAALLWAVLRRLGIPGAFL